MVKDEAPKFQSLLAVVCKCEEPLKINSPLLTTTPDTPCVQTLLLLKSTIDPDVEFCKSNQLTMFYGLILVLKRSALLGT